jgi:hypothetical protein
MNKITCLTVVLLLAGFGECGPREHPPDDPPACLLPPCGGTDGEWNAWGRACLPEGECRLFFCPRMGDDRREACNP